MYIIKRIVLAISGVFVYVLWWMYVHLLSGAESDDAPASTKDDRVNGPVIEEFGQRVDDDVGRKLRALEEGRLHLAEIPGGQVRFPRLVIGGFSEDGKRTLTYRLRIAEINPRNLTTQYYSQGYEPGGFYLNPVLDYERDEY